MSYKSILVHATADPQQSNHLWCAADLADDLTATILGLGVEALAPLGTAVGGGYEASESAWIASQRELVAENLRRAHANFEAVTGARSREWHTRWADPTDAMAQLAKAADLIMVGGGRSVGQDAYRIVDAGRLLIMAGRPVLICPPRAKRLPARSAVIAWKDTRECRRAVADALPLLKRAQTVVILKVCSEADSGCATSRTLDLAAALARHGVIARSRIEIRRNSSAETIMEAADAMGASLIVAGGYGHSRLGEWAFGGVTKALLHQDRRFVLFSH